MDHRHGDANWEKSDQLIEKTKNLYDKLVIFWYLLNCWIQHYLEATSKKIYRELKARPKNGRLNSYVIKWCFDYPFCPYNSDLP